MVLPLGTGRFLFARKVARSNGPVAGEHRDGVRWHAPEVPWINRVTLRRDVAEGACLGVGREGGPADPTSPGGRGHHGEVMQLRVAAGAGRHRGCRRGFLGPCRMDLRGAGAPRTEEMATCVAVPGHVVRDATDLVPWREEVPWVTCPHDGIWSDDGFRAIYLRPAVVGLAWDREQHRGANERPRLGRLHQVQGVGGSEPEAFVRRADAVPRDGAVSGALLPDYHVAPWQVVAVGGRVGGVGGGEEQPAWLNCQITVGPDVPVRDEERDRGAKDHVGLGKVTDGVL